MSALLHPVGPRAPRVYWVRRFLVLAVLAGVVTVALVLVNSFLGGGSASGAGPDGPGAEPSGSAADGSTEPADDGADTAGADTAGAGLPQPGLPEQLAVALTADARSYAGGALPVLTVSVTNVSGESCTVDAGEANREVLITSGSDRIWSSLDCPAEPAERRLLLPAGGRDDTAITWPRTRSAAGCAGDLPTPRPGTYTAVATLAGASSTGAVFELG
ncbi:MAG TPA: hypothetical protein PKB06_13025 [Actinotalea sp.]|nr:hypothetical protein [Actinotalea sp.]